MMDDATLQRRLQSVGMAAFVTHLALFDGGLRDADATAALHSLTGWKPKATRTRVTNARAILAAGRRHDALALIAASDRVSDAIRAAARAAR